MLVWKILAVFELSFWGLSIFIDSNFILQIIWKSIFWLPHWKSMEFDVFLGNKGQWISIVFRIGPCSLNIRNRASVSFKCLEFIHFTFRASFNYFDLRAPFKRDCRVEFERFDQIRLKSYPVINHFWSSVSSKSNSSLISIQLTTNYIIVFS